MDGNHPQEIPRQIKARKHMSWNKDNPNKNKTINKKAIVYHKLPNDRGALVGMCGKYEECFPNVATH